MVVARDPAPVSDVGAFKVAKPGSDADTFTVPLSGSDTWTLTVIVLPSASVTSAMGAMVMGPWSALLSTVICVVALPAAVFEAMKVTSYSPAWVVVGVQVNVPDVKVPFGVNCAPAGAPEAIRFVIAS